MRLHPILIVGWLLLAAGCGSNIVPVSGTVTLDGKALADATLVFEPISAENNPGSGSVGKSDAEGKFSLRLMAGNDNGAVIGKHQIRITAYKPDPQNPTDPFHGIPLVPAEYNSQSKLTFEVPAGGTSSANFDLKSTAPFE